MGSPKIAACAASWVEREVSKARGCDGKRSYFSPHGFYTTETQTGTQSPPRRRSGRIGILCSCGTASLMRSPTTSCCIEPLAQRFQVTPSHQQYCAPLVAGAAVVVADRIAWSASGSMGRHVSDHYRISICHRFCCTQSIPPVSARQSYQDRV